MMKIYNDCPFCEKELSLRWNSSIHYYDEFVCDRLVTVSDHSGTSFLKGKIVKYFISLQNNIKIIYSLIDSKSITTILIYPQAPIKFNFFIDSSKLNSIDKIKNLTQLL